MSLYNDQGTVSLCNLIQAVDASIVKRRQADLKNG